MKKRLLKKLNLEPTRKNYLAIDRWEPDPELAAAVFAVSSCLSLKTDGWRNRDLGNPPYLRPELGHNSGACAPSRMTSLLSWIASLIKRKASTRPAHAFDAHSVVGRPAKTTAGLVAVAMSGIRSTREECARRVSTSGLQHSVSLAAAGRHTPIGIRSHETIEATI